MADGKTYSEAEHIAILADRVATETAALNAKVDQLEGEKTELGNKLDVELTAREAAETRATAAETGLEAYKSEVTEREAAAARKDGRITKLREAAKHMPDEFFEDTARVERIVAMDESQFEGYLGDIATSTGGTAPVSIVPRQTAMAGSEVAPVPVVAGRNFLMRGFVAPKEA